MKLNIFALSSIAVVGSLQFASSNAATSTEARSLQLRKAQECLSITDYICDNDDYSTLCGVLEEDQDLADVLSGGEFTLFAPNNKAIGDRIDDIEPYWGTGPDAGMYIMKFHAIEGQTLMFDDLICSETVETLSENQDSRTKCTNKGAEKFQTGRGNNDLGTMPKIVEPDIRVCNGVIHGVDDMLLPSLKKPGFGVGEDKWDIDKEFYGDQDYWLESDWFEMSNDVRNAAKVLGFTGKMWDKDDKSPIDRDWSDLNKAQKQAAITLGYNKKTWVADLDEWKSEDSRRYDWSELPMNVKDAAEVLGFTGKMWDGNEKSLVFDKDWKGLNKAQQKAAITLGYDRFEDVDEWKSLDLLDVEMPNKWKSKAWRHYGWSDLPNNVRDAAKVLGYTDKTWDNKDKSVDFFDKKWSELNKAERKAVITLGYKRFDDFDDWKSDDWLDYGWSKKPNNKSKDWRHYGWSELPNNVKDAAKVMGFTGKTWDDKEKPFNLDKDWMGLTKAQKKAAITMGYNKFENFDEWKKEDWLRYGWTKMPKDKSVDWRHYAWSEMPNNVKDAAEVLDFTGKMWDDNVKSPNFDKNWKELTKAQKKAAITLGYTRFGDFEDFEGFDDFDEWTSEDQFEDFVYMSPPGGTGGPPFDVEEMRACMRACRD